VGIAPLHRFRGSCGILASRQLAAISGGARERWHEVPVHDEQAPRRPAATRTEREKPTVPPENAAAWKKTSPPEVSAPVSFPESRGAGQFSAQAAALKGS
jgi:hypothetical protein